MKYRKLGKTGLRVSVIGVGTWQLGGEWGIDFTQDMADEVLGKAAEVGINLIDTAECYGDHLSEQLIGNYTSKNRKQWIIATKFGHKFHNKFERTTHWKAEEVVQQLEDSLDALQTDYVDLYQFHSGQDSKFDNSELWAALDEQVQMGKIKNLGISIGGNNTHQTGGASKVNAKVIQVIYNRLTQEPEKEVFPLCLKQNLGVLARVPLASGFLSGKYDPGATFTKNDFRSRGNKGERDARLQKVEEIKQNEVPRGVPMAEWALGWCLQHPAVSAVIPGCKTAEQVESNARAAELDLVRDDHPQAWE